MKHLSVLIALAGLLGLLLFSGCQKDSSSVLSDEQLEEQAITETVTSENIEESDYLADWGIDDGSEDNMYDGFSTFLPGSNPEQEFQSLNNIIRFGRRLNRQVPRTVLIRRISPDSIVVHLERIWAGGFYTFEKISTGSGLLDTVVIHRKPLIHSVKRVSYFTRRTDDQEALNDPRRRWKLSAISLSDGVSRPTNTLQIHLLQIRSSGGEYLAIENPLRTVLQLPEDLPLFAQGETVNVRVLVSNSTGNPVINNRTGASETVLLHFGINRFHHARKQFEYMGVDPDSGYDIFEGQWTVHEPALRPFHAIVDVIDNGTIYETDPDLYPYNSATWGMPYRVVVTR
jgi:hypothetical protein